MRNSVKATVDAYDGTVTLYAWDESDPLLQTWSKAFPGTVAATRATSATTLMAHVRYPEDLFKVQREVYARYHVTDPQVFYTSQDAWQVPIDPTASGAGDVAQPPYYLTLQMPGDDVASFSLTTTFAPVNRETLAAFMAVNSDADRSGATASSEHSPCPGTPPFPGPSQMQNKIESDQNVSNELLALRRGGSAEVELGNLLTLPVAGGPDVRRTRLRSGHRGSVVPDVAQGHRVVRRRGGHRGHLCRGSLAVVLRRRRDTAAAVVEAAAAAVAVVGARRWQRRPRNSSWSSALADATAAYERGQEALANGDFAAYGEAQQDLARRTGARAGRGRRSLGSRLHQPRRRARHRKRRRAPRRRSPSPPQARAGWAPPVLPGLLRPRSLSEHQRGVEQLGSSLGS